MATPKPDVGAVSQLTIYPKLYMIQRNTVRKMDKYIEDKKR